MSSVNYAIREELQQYYEQEGYYPNSLDVIKGAIITNLYIAGVPDNPKELELLPRFKYSTDGESYSITWSVSNHGKIYNLKEYGRYGKSVKAEFYKDGKLVTAHEWKVNGNESGNEPGSHLKN